MASGTARAGERYTHSLASGVFYIGTSPVISLSTSKYSINVHSCRNIKLFTERTKY